VCTWGPVKGIKEDPGKAVCPAFEKKGGRPDSKKGTIEEFASAGEAATIFSKQILQKKEGEPAVDFKRRDIRGPKKKWVETGGGPNKK